MDKPITDVDHANRIGKALFEALASKGFDQLGIDPGPLNGDCIRTSACRLPGLLRVQTGRIQELRKEWQGSFSVGDLETWLTQWLPDWQTRTEWRMDAKPKQSSFKEKPEDAPSRNRVIYDAMLACAEKGDWRWDQNHWWKWKITHYARQNWDQGPEKELWQVYTKTSERRSHREFQDLVKCLREERTASIAHHPNLLNLENGVLDLDSLTLKATSKDYGFGYALPLHYRPELMSARPEPKTWCRMLNERIPLPEDRLMLERFFGYALTDDRSKHHVLVLFGPGACGKSTLLSSFKRIVGPELAVEESIKRVLTEPAHAVNIIGKRVNLSPESRFDLKDLESFKSLIAFEGISIHTYYVGKKTVPHGCKFICSTNNEGWLPNTIEIRRRIRVVRFGTSVPPREQDPNLSDKIWEERELIFHRILAQYLEVRKDASLLENASTSAYMNVADCNINPIASWLDETGLAPGDHWRPTSFLHYCYQQDSNDNRMTVHEFARRLRESGLISGEGDRREYNLKYHDSPCRSRGVWVNQEVNYLRLKAKASLNG